MHVHRSKAEELFGNRKTREYIIVKSACIGRPNHINQQFFLF